MRIALCFSGQPRFIKETYKTFLNNLIIPNNITDVFFHLWWDDTIIDKTLKVSNNPTVFKIEKEDLNFIVDNYKPLQILVEKTTTIDNSPIFLKPPINLETPQVPIGNLKHSYYSTYRSLLLKKQFEEENEFVYDAVIRARTDLVVKFPLSINELDLSVLNISSTWVNLQQKWGNDTFCISNSNNMNIYGEMWHNFMNYNLNDGCRFHGEQLIFHHLHTANKLTLNPRFDFTVYGRHDPVTGALL